MSSSNNLNCLTSVLSNRVTRSVLYASVMSISLLMQPILVQAQGVTADPNAGANNTPTIGAAPNGVPLVDIATPNGAGLSHNKYHDFNVANPGLILNNHNGEVGTSQLGGVVPGNPNLRQSGSASVILNEVTSGNRTALEGPTEVFGRKADVIIANPNGITCNGCGFINTPRATLTTGIPQIGLDGSLAGFDVRGGDVTIGERGANLASGKGSVDIFDIVSRTVHLDGAVAGHDIGITAGAGKFDYASREMKELYDIAGKPEYAIDGSALGALQGDRIKLIATEKGVGVRMRNDMAANAGQLTLSADGKISINNASGRDGVKVASRSKTVTAKKITSKKNVDIKANEGITIETIGADGDLMVDSGADNVGLAAADIKTNSKIGIGSDVNLKAGNNISLKSGFMATKPSTGSVASESSTIKAGTGGFDITVKGNTDLKGGIINSDQLSTSSYKTSNADKEPNQKQADNISTGATPWSETESAKKDDTGNVSSSISAGDDIKIKATGDVNLKGATIDSQKQTAPSTYWYGLKQADVNVQIPKDVHQLDDAQPDENKLTFEMDRHVSLTP